MDFVMLEGEIVLQRMVIRIVGEESVKIGEGVKCEQIVREW
jgi:hypothetical protein